VADVRILQRGTRAPPARITRPRLIGHASGAYLVDVFSLK
jgi:hypothetical protein